jgi:cytochrome c peroxidase
MVKTIFIFCILAIFTMALSNTNYRFEKPAHFPEALYDFSKNPLKPEIVELGKRLFYDPILSKDSTVSCASCHSPFNAFAHTDHDLSHGIRDQIGFRNAPALFNLAWHSNFMWDGAVNHLDMQALAPISSHTEMDENISNICLKLSRSDNYQKLFNKAFGESNISGERVLKTLSQFQLSLVSAESKYDSVIRNLTVFTPQEKKGYDLFLKHCNNCHSEPLFSNFQFADNGLPLDTTLNDFGRMKVTQNRTDSLKFKIPSLRNLQYSYPYMHDGRFNKLSDVLNHYVKGIENRPGLAIELENRIPLSSTDKVDLIAFLLTLNDKNFVFNKEYGFPKFDK